MQEIQMALMQGPISQINELFTQNLENISQNFRLSMSQLKAEQGQNMQFQGKLHLDLQIDKLLLQIQECKISVAEILQMYLPYSTNQIDIKTIKLSNFSHQPQIKAKLYQKQLQNVGKNQRLKDENKKEQNNKPLQLNVHKNNYVQRQGSYEINGLQNNGQQKQQTQKIVEGAINTFQKQIQGQKIGQTLVNELSNEKIYKLAENIIQNQLKQGTGCQILQKVQKQLSNFKKTLMLRQSQLGMIILVLENKHNQSFKNLYRQIYKPIQKYIIPIQKINQPINAYILEQVFQIQSKFLIEYLKLTKQIQQKLQRYQQSQTEEWNLRKSLMNTFTKESNKVKLEKALKLTYKLKVINSKIITMAEIFPYACIKDKNDLFSFSKSHQRWQRLFQNDIIRFKFYGDPEKVRESFQNIKSNLNIINASMNIINQSKNINVFDYKHWGKIYESTSKLLKVALFKSDALHEAQVMISEPDGKLAKQIWNLTEQKTLKNFVSAILPAIQFSQKIFLPRVLKQYIQNKGNIDLPQQLYISHITNYGNELYEQAPYSKRIQCRMNAKFRINRRYETKTKNNQTQKKPESYSKMFFNKLNTMTKTISNMNSYFKKQGQNNSSAILHIHGGGFISMSSFIHQTYTRNWANQLQVPILSVDYGKAPQNSFPKGLYDCLQAYIWLRFVFRQVYQVEIQKVYIVGDSAGGNLAAALTTLLILWGLPKPDGLVLVYPALNLNDNNYTPSLLCALNDMILPHTFLKICVNAYAKDTSIDRQKDFLLSPINTPSSILKKYPKTKIFVGGKDPFHDDCCRFVQKINQCNSGIADLTVFDEFPHGFLQFDMNTYPNQQSRKGTKQVQNGLRQLIYGKDK